MEINDLITLAKAGFSKDEILALTSPSIAAEDPGPVTAASVQTEVPTEAHDGALPESSDIYADQIAKIGASLDALEKKIQGINLIQAQMSAEAIRKDLPKDIIARIIDPYSKKEV